MRAPIVLTLSALSILSVACSDSPDTSPSDSTPPPDAISDSARIADASADVTARDASDAAVPTLPSCPTTGKGAILAPGPCFVFTPAQAGASTLGDNADVLQYALEPSVAPKGALVVQLNGSLGSPAGQIADPTKNFYDAAALAGFHVLGLAYKSTAIVGVLCNNAPACFGPTRRTIVTGAYAPGAPSSLANTRLDEGIVMRVALDLKLLIAAHPGGGWETFVADATSNDPLKYVAWSKVIASGHSQGGGHAAYLAQVVPLRRVVQLSSTCDESGGVPAPWTQGSQPWLVSPKTSFVGFAAPTIFTGPTPTSGDTTCPYHAAVWQAMGLDPSRMHDDAAVCTKFGNSHGASIECVDKFPRWAGLLE